VNSKRTVDLRRAQIERGSALLLVPVMVLILILAAGLVVDSSIAFSTKRDLVEAASAAANDASSAISEDPTYTSGGTILSGDLVSKRAQQAIDARRNHLGHDVTVQTAIVTGADGRPAVRVTVTGSAHFLFSKAIPGRSSTMQLSATVTSSLRESR
jgi:Flp pilus assembly protein TadG